MKQHSINKQSYYLTLLLARQSTSGLTSPAPTEDELAVILTTAMRVPDHGNLAPWHFTVFQGDALVKLGDIFTQAARQDKAPQAVIDKAAKMPLRAPLIIMVSTRYQQHDKVPQAEQLIAAGCTVHAMQMAAFALGYGGIWRTGDFCYHPYVKQQLNVDGDNDIVGFLYLGSLTKDPVAKPRKPYDDFVSYF